MRFAQRLQLTATFIVFVAFAALHARTSSAHEPITTKVTFNKEIARIFQRSCWGCHSAGKIKADIPLTTYEEARPWAKAIKEEVLEKRMPPYQAVKGYGVFAHDYILPQREVELIVSWVEGGAPKGEPKNYPQAVDGWALGQPDLILQPEADAKLAGEGEEARCFSLPTGLKQARWLSGLDFQPGNGTVVYRVSFALEQTLPKRMKGKCADEGGAPLGNWAPNQTPLQAPAGVAQLLPAGARIKLTIHYRKNGEATSDRSRLALYFAKERNPKPLRQIAINAAPATLPPSEQPHKLRADYLVSADAEAVAIRPLLYPFGQSLEATAYFPDGSAAVLIWARDYRYAWQPAYQFKKPIKLPKGTRVEVTAYLDNSENNPNNPNDPVKAVRFAAPLCEMLLTQTAPARQARR
jgi:hypothetical protein